MRIGFIGTGNMGSAILKGIVGAGFEPSDITITNRTIEKAYKFQSLGVSVVLTSQEVIENSDIIILGMKPDGYKAWLDSNDVSSKKIISIGAGITSKFMSQYTDDFVITMPNTPSKLGFGSTLIVNSSAVSEEVLRIFSAVGSVHLIAESELDVYTLVTGCSPAYFFSFINKMSETLQNQYNLDSELTSKMLIEVLEGSAAMLKETPDPKELCNNVCSPGGITIEVVNKLNEGLPSVFEAGFASAIKRTNELKDNN